MKDLVREDARMFGGLASQFFIEHDQTFANKRSRVCGVTRSIAKANAVTNLNGATAERDRHRT
jgi:hypothetical protein